MTAFERTLPTARAVGYSVMLYLGLLTGLATATVSATRIGLDPVRAATAVLFLIPFCLLGVRLLPWLVERGRRRRPVGLRAAEGGAMVYGGTLAIAVSPLVLTALDLPLATFWDAAAPAIVAGLAVTRLGCVLRGCCAGRMLELPLGARRSWTFCAPARALETAGLAALWLALPPSPGAPGSTFLTGAAAYGLLRLALDPLRARRRLAGGVPVNRLLSVLLALLSLLTLWSRSG